MQGSAFRTMQFNLLAEGLSASPKDKPPFEAKLTSDGGGFDKDCYSPFAQRSVESAASRPLTSPHLTSPSPAPPLPASPCLAPVLERSFIIAICIHGMH